MEGIEITASITKVFNCYVEGKELKHLKISENDYDVDFKQNMQS